MVILAFCKKILSHLKFTFAQWQIKKYLYNFLFESVLFRFTHNSEWRKNNVGLKRTFNNLLKSL